MFQLIYPSEPAQLLPKPTAVNPKPLYGAEEEMVPIVEESGLVIAQSRRDYCHGGSRLLHPVVHLHIIDRFDRLCLQKRSMKKKLLPLKWDTAVGGHVIYGESIEEALHREAAEELGFYDFNPVFLSQYVFECEQEKELVSVFATVGSFHFRPDSDEVSEVRYWEMKDIESRLGKSIFTPNFEGEFAKVRKSLEALL